MSTVCACSLVWVKTKQTNKQINKQTKGADSRLIIIIIIIIIIITIIIIIIIIIIMSVFLERFSI